MSSPGDRPLSDRPMPSSFDENDDFYNESGFQKVTRKLKTEPLIPLGCLLTVAAFTNAYRAMRRGDHNQVQRMFRARVLAQGFTVLAMVAGGVYFGAERTKERELWKVQQAQAEEEKRMKWIRELEARDAEEKALRERIDRRRKKSPKERSGGESGAVGDVAAAAAETVAGADGAVRAGGGGGGDEKSGGGGSGVLAALGGWFVGRAPPTKTDEALSQGPVDGDKFAVDKAEESHREPEPAAIEKKKHTSVLGDVGGMFSKRKEAGSSPDEKEPASSKVEKK